MRYLINICGLLILCFSLNGQAITFTNSYSWFPTGEHQGGFFLEMPDSSYYLIVVSGPVVGSPNNIETILLNLNKFGDTLWSKHYGIYSTFSGFDFYDDTTFIVSGKIYNINSSIPSIAVGRLNLNGDTSSVKYYGYLPAICNGAAGTIYKDLNNDFILKSNYACDYGYLKIDSIGNELWHHWHNMAYGCWDIKPDPFGDYVSCGGDGGVINPYVVARLDSGGNELWRRNYGYNPSQASYRIATQVTFTADSNYLVSCYGNDFQLMKINRINGDTIWTRNYADTANGIFFHLNTVAPAGTDTFICVSDRYYMLIDANGDSIWKKQLPFHPDNDVYTAKKTLDGGFAFSGSYFRFSPQRRIACFFKTNADGIILSTGIFDLDAGIPLQFYPNPASDELFISTIKLAPENDLLFSLYDLQGRIALQQKYDATKAIDVTTVPEGLYVGVLKGKEKEVRGKITVQH